MTESVRNVLKTCSRPSVIQRNVRPSGITSAKRGKPGAARFIETLPVPGERFETAVYELTVGQFRQFVRRAAYQIRGKNADQLKKALRDKTYDDIFPAAYLSLDDARAFCEWRNSMTREVMAIPTIKQLKRSWQEFGARLLDRGKYEWTNSPTTHIKANLLLQYNMSNGNEWNNPPFARLESIYVRLVRIR